MKKIKIVLLLLPFILLIGCGVDGDFYTRKAFVINKTQNNIQKSQSIAEYTIRCTDERGFGIDVVLILHENFSQVNDKIHFSSDGKLMYAGENKPIIENK